MARHMGGLAGRLLLLPEVTEAFEEAQLPLL